MSTTTIYHTLTLCRAAEVHGQLRKHYLVAIPGERVLTQANNQTHPSHDLVAGGYELKIQGTVDRLIVLLLYIIIDICSGGITLPFCSS
uniref:Uncharacterized protein n=1 Tax=Quercus lobata TaxID=97700 RepID=A0A7N2M0E6_QUELO